MEHPVPVMHSSTHGFTRPIVHCDRVPKEFIGFIEFTSPPMHRDRVLTEFTVDLSSEQPIVVPLSQVVVFSCACKTRLLLCSFFLV